MGSGLLAVLPCAAVTTGQQWYFDGRVPPEAQREPVAAWRQWTTEIRRALVGAAIQELPADAALFRTHFVIRDVPQIAHIGFWKRTGGHTRERGDESPVACLRVISDRHGRIMVLMTHNTDILDSWEREGDDEAFFEAFARDGYALGINAALYALMH